MADRRAFDVVVIGGGVNGTGVARDCAMRGLSVALIEKNDVASGASGANSGMIHGGARYLLDDASVTKISCLDSGYIQRIAPHLCFRIPFIVPVLQSQFQARAYLELMEVYFEAYDVYQPLKNALPHTRLTRDEVRQLEPGITQHIVGAVTFDEWGIDPFRLCVANAVSAADHGAQVMTYHEVTGLLCDGDRVSGVRVRNLASGEEVAFESQVVANLGGAWAPRIAAMAGAEVRLRPGKGIHLVYGRRLSNYSIVALTIDGRQIFLEPHENATILGTTDDDYYGDPDDLWATEDEIEYLLQGMETIFPSIRSYRVTRTMVGLRPTLFEYGPIEDKLSRDHAIIDHEAEGAPGLVTMVGGKLAAYRLMSEEMTDAICQRLGVSRPCTTHEVPLPGGTSQPNIADLQAKVAVSPYALNRLAYRHGSRAPDILEAHGQDRELTAVCLCEPVLEAEIRWVIREEGARSLDDIRRRTRLAMGPCQGTRCIARAAEILQEELGLEHAEALAQMLDLLQERHRGKAPALAGASLAQEELSQARYFLVGDLGRQGVAADPARTRRNRSWRAEDDR
jgi:glycerol-3-phosphate dehydrogenase